jgi:hypothetical protein
MEEGDDAMLIDMGGRGAAGNNLGGHQGGPPPNGGGGGANGGMAMPSQPGFVGGYPYMAMPAAPQPQGPMQPPAYHPFQYPSVPQPNGPSDEKFPLNFGGAGGGGGFTAPPKFRDFKSGFNIPPSDDDFKEFNVNKVI